MAASEHVIQLDFTISGPLKHGGIRYRVALALLQLATRLTRSTVEFEISQVRRPDRREPTLADLEAAGADIGLGLRSERNIGENLFLSSDDKSRLEELSGIPAQPSRPTRVPSLRDRLRRLFGR